MGADTKIEWCHHTANTWWGCTKVSDGCKNCYAETFSKRTGHNVWGPNASRRMMKGVWNEVYKWAKAAAAAGERRRVFWGSMMDVCEDRPELVEPRKRFCGMVEELEDLDFLILTKRPENYLRLMPWGYEPWPKNAWAGTSTEHQETLDNRVPHLLRVNAGIHWLSAEPLLGPLNLSKYLPGRHADGGCVHCGFLDSQDGHAANCPTRTVAWIVAGGESGPAARACNVEWIRSIVTQCHDARTLVFVKQLGALPVRSKRFGHGTMGFGPHDEEGCPTCRVCGGGDFGPCDGGAMLCNRCDAEWSKLKDPKGGDITEFPPDLRVRQMPKAEVAA